MTTPAPKALLTNCITGRLCDPWDCTFRETFLQPYVVEAERSSRHLMAKEIFRFKVGGFAKNLSRADMLYQCKKTCFKD